VDADPKALILKETASCPVRVLICGDCGLIWFFAGDPAKLLRAQLTATERATSLEMIPPGTEPADERDELIRPVRFEVKRADDKILVAHDAEIPDSAIRSGFLPRKLTEMVAAALAEIDDPGFPSVTLDVSLDVEGLEPLAARVRASRSGDRWVVHEHGFRGNASLQVKGKGRTFPEAMVEAISAEIRSNFA